MSAAATQRERILVGVVGEFPVGTFVIRTIGGQEVGIVRLESGEMRAVRNWCPHKGAPICRGIVGGTWPPGEPGTLEFARDGEVLVCPWHGYEYDLRTGRELYHDVPTRLRLYTIEESDGQVFVIV